MPTPKPTPKLEPQVESPIDLTTPEPQLRSRLRDLLTKEGNLYSHGTCCKLKDEMESQSICLVCPFSSAHIDPRSFDDRDQHDEEAGRILRQRLLCRIGKEQQSIALALRIQRQQHVN